MSRGKMVVMKVDHKPWGYRDSSGEIVGMEIDMAKDVAAKWVLIWNLSPFNHPIGCSF